MNGGNGAGAPLILAVPSKGRLQDNANAFFARAGLDVVRGRGVRDYRGTLKGLDNVEIAFLSAGEITTQLAAGSIHMGITGRGTSARDYCGRRRAGRAASAARLRQRQCRRGGAARLDRRAQHGRSRGRCLRLPRQARTAHAHRDEVREISPAASSQRTTSAITASSGEFSARPRRAPPPQARPNSSSTSPRPARRWRRTR